MNVCETTEVLAARRRRELLNIFVHEIYVYSFPDPTLELSYMCMRNGTIFIRLCSSHGGIFRGNFYVFVTWYQHSNLTWGRIPI